MKNIFSRFRALPLLIILVVALSGCKTRSISDSGYDNSRRNRNPAYHGELNEFDVLGIERTEAVTEDQIAKAREDRKKIHLNKGSSVLLIQSGAAYPDDPMVAELKKYFSVVPFTGTPDQSHGASYAKSLRFAAARGGCDAVVCYWGILETAKENLSSKTVSWVPIVGSVVPDQNQHMRIRLKVAVVDVATGSWSMFSPDAFDDKAISAMFGRKKSDQEQVAKLKEKAYQTAAADLVKLFSK